MKVIKFFNPDGSLIKQRPLVYFDASRRFTTLYLLEEGVYKYFWDCAKIQSVDIDFGLVTIRYENGNYIEIMKSVNELSDLQHGYSTP